MDNLRIFGWRPRGQTAEQGVEQEVYTRSNYEWDFDEPPGLDDVMDQLRLIHEDIWALQERLNETRWVIGFSVLAFTVWLAWPSLKALWS